MLKWTPPRVGAGVFNPLSDDRWVEIESLHQWHTYQQAVEAISFSVSQEI
jgi:hypothetical protein